MGRLEAPHAVKYFIALLSGDRELLEAVDSKLAAVVGTCDNGTTVLPWRESRYYEREMGPHLMRRFIAVAALAPPDWLVAAKLITQSVENEYRRSDAEGGGRRINLDPGYLDRFKVVLASTKNASQLIYLRDGIFAEVTLNYHSGSFHDLPHTYPDYLWPESMQFFGWLRSRYLAQLRAAE